MLDYRWRISVEIRVLVPSEGEMRRRNAWAKSQLGKLLAALQRRGIFESYKLTVGEPRLVGRSVESLDDAGEKAVG